jgi:hypothetical protein
MNWEQLHQRKMELSFLQNIPDMAIYAAAWNCLATDYRFIGAPANAEYCQSRADHYGKFAGEYVRLIEQPFAELVEVPSI